MNTKQKGDIAEIQVIAALIKQGKTVLTPFGDRCRYDLVIDEDGLFYRIQVKHGRLRKGAVEFSTHSVTTKHGKAVSRTYQNEVEFFGVYCSDNNAVYLVPIADCGCSLTRLSQQKRKANQWVQKYASAYLVA